MVVGITFGTLIEIFLWGAAFGSSATIALELLVFRKFRKKKIDKNL